MGRGDTVSTALAATLFYLSRSSESYERLQSEICTNFSTIDTICQGRALSRCHYLRACFDEAMRLSPPAQGPFWREVTFGWPGGSSLNPVILSLILAEQHAFHFWLEALADN